MPYVRRFAEQAGFAKQLSMIYYNRAIKFMRVIQTSRAKWLSKFNLQWLNLAFFRGYKHIDIAAFDERLFVAVGDVFYELPDLFKHRYAGFWRAHLAAF